MTAQFAGAAAGPDSPSDASSTRGGLSTPIATALSSSLVESGVSTPASAASAHDSVSSTVFSGQETPTSTADSNGSSTFNFAPNSTLSSNDGISKSSGLASSAKVGLGIGLGVGVPLLIGIAALCLFAIRKRKNRQGEGPYGPIMTNEKARDGGSFSSHSAPQEMHSAGSNGPFPPASVAAERANVAHAEQLTIGPDQHSSPPPSAAGGIATQQSPLSQHQGAYQRHDFAYSSTPLHDSAPVSAIESPPRLNISVARPSLSASETNRLDLHDRPYEEPPSPVSPVSNVSPVTSRPASLMRGEAGWRAPHD
ncbi:hypothetical protein EJ03DRAFT_30837 [Teratosphaeria nubilosa]|uniref:Mid2 domain-containing protein n=1 Tax=Teratosphaeria nubilosa TaxID=161662 RepID=A0A6G1LFA2_9PEZI|nr:hypothetical protein EJ03DRAFT_30837 [Teratosphaeria nubilosa]